MTGENNAFVGFLMSQVLNRILLHHNQRLRIARKNQNQNLNNGEGHGKKSDPEYEAAIAYIRKKTHIQVKRLLLDKEEQGEARFL